MFLNFILHNRLSCINYITVIIHDFIQSLHLAQKSMLKYLSIFTFNISCSRFIDDIIYQIIWIKWRMVPLRCCALSRIIQLWEPFKESQLTRSLESWQNLVTKLRQLLLVSFNRHLGKFEDQVRSLREKRTEPRWSFTTYFLLHVSWSAIHCTYYLCT